MEREEREKGYKIHSEQFGELAMTPEICLFMDFRVGDEDVSRRMISWRLEGGRVKRIGMDIFSISFFYGLLDLVVDVGSESWRWNVCVSVGV